MYPVYYVCPSYVIAHTVLCIAGTGPWKLAMLAACLYLWDIAWGVEKPSFKEDWLVKVRHVERSYLLLSTIFHKIRSACVCISVRRPCVSACCIVWQDTTVHGVVCCIMYPDTAVPVCRYCMH